MKQQILNFFQKHRLLDGYIGILGFVLHYKILANYSGWFHLFGLSLRNVFYIDLSYHLRPSDYPAFHFQFEVFNKSLINNGERSAEIISNKVNKYLAENEAKKQKALSEIKKYLPENQQDLLSKIQ